MTNPVSMMLGSFPFRSLGFGYQGVQRKVETPWADVAVAQDMNQLQWTGPTAEEVTIRGVLFPAEWAASLSGLIGAATSGTPMFLVSGDAGSGVIHGMFVVQSVEEDRGFHDAGGRAWRNAYTLSLKRYGKTAGGGIVGALAGLW